MAKVFVPTDSAINSLLLKLLSHCANSSTANTIFLSGRTIIKKNFYLFIFSRWEHYDNVNCK